MTKETSATARLQQPLILTADEVDPHEKAPGAVLGAPRSDTALYDTWLRVLALPGPERT